MNTLAIRMMELIRSEITQTDPDISLFKEMSTLDWQDLLEISKYHDKANIVADKALKNNLIPDGEINETFWNCTYLAMKNYEKQEKERRELAKVLEEEKVPFIFLKGTEIGKYYPEQWMRTCCDIDILVHPEDIERAKEFFVKELQYSYIKESFHDLEFKTVKGVNIELHFNLKNNLENLDKVLEKCWTYTTKLTDYQYAFSNEFQLFYQYAHAYYHFKYGGCGIKPFMDIYLLNKKMIYDKEVFNNLVTKANMVKFVEKITDLSEVWFGGKTGDEVTEQMERFVLLGGNFGTEKNYSSVRKANNYGKFAGLMRRIWMPYKELCLQYPKLKGRRILQPVFEIHRWTTFFSSNMLKKGVSELKVHKNTNENELKDINKMLISLDIK